MRTLTTLILFSLLLTACSHLPPECRGEPNEVICVINHATANGDATTCDALTGPGQRAWCLNAVANATKSTGPCERIADKRGVEYCKRDRFLEQDNPSLCEELTLDTPHDSCLLAFSKRDWRLCQGARDEKLRDDCFDAGARREEEPEGCEGIGNLTRRDLCLFTTSIAANKTDSCAKINEQELSDFCYLNIAARRNDVSVCDLIESANKGVCRQIVLNGTAVTTEGVETISLK